MSPSAPIALGIDIGGTSIKATLVDVAAGSALGPTTHIELDGSWTVEGMLDAVAGCVELFRRENKDFDHAGVVGVGFPAVCVNGVVLTDPTALRHPGFRGLDLRAALTERVGREVALLNDADAAGLAEMRHGAGNGRAGTILTVTLGTGVGSGLFRDGILVPNVELGHLYLKDHHDVVEIHMAARIKAEQHLTWEEYGRRLADFVDHVHRLLCTDLIVLGGGITAAGEMLLAHLHTEVAVALAEFGNTAGAVGAATHAWEHS